MRHRIIQYQGKRYSLKLDEIVWQCLEAAAARAGIRLNQLVAMVAREVSDESSVTGALRLFCLRQSLERAEQLERELNRLSLASRGVPVNLVAEASPAPCLVVSRGQVILDANPAALTWMGVDGAALIGKSVEHYFQIKSALPLAGIVEQFLKGLAKVVQARIVYLRPGRLVMAPANLCPVMTDNPDDFTYLILVDSTERN